ncbi:MAG: hypothetical protein AAGF90_14485, partial [Pseudomonadota bacterium]
PSQDVINANLPDRVVSHGEKITLAGLDVEILELTPGEANGAAMLHAPDHAMIFPGDVVQHDKIPMPFVSHETWLAQLEALSAALPGETTAFQGHGRPERFDVLARETARYLTTARDKVIEKLDEGRELRPAAVEALVAELSAAFPFHVAGGGADRAGAIGGLSRRIAAQANAGDAGGPVFAAG